jgi:hypothetical protein
MSLIDSVTSYCTVAEADAILGPQDPWVGATTDQKDQALKQGKLYIDFYYRCAWTTDEAPGNVKEANAFLANQHLTQSLWARQDGTAPLKQKRVKAGGVETESSYAAVQGTGWTDPFTDITALLMQDGVCKLTKSQGGSTRFVLLRR